MLTELEKVIQEKYHLNYDNNGLLCPFHDDNRGGSFKINEYNGEIRYKCFSCNESGNEISLRNEIYLRNNNLTEAEEEVMYIKYSDCNEEQKKIKQEYYKKIEAACGKLEKVSGSSMSSQSSFTITELDLIHSFYERIISYTRLSRKDKEYLINERKLSEDEITKYKYRSFNKFSIPVIQNVFELFKSFCSTAQMLRIPGVFLDDDNKLAFKEVQGIVIPITQNGKFVALQVRATQQYENSLKYFWISSADKGGTSPGAPWYSIENIDVSHQWIITEGQFKAAIIHKYIKASANIISIQGIGNGNALANKIIEFYSNEEDERNIEKPRIIIALDKDTIVNEDGIVDAGVKAKRKTINSWLEKLYKDGFEIFIMKWNEPEKGIDDVFINHNNAVFTYLSYNEYITNKGAQWVEKDHM